MEYLFLAVLWNVVPETNSTRRTHRREARRILTAGWFDLDAFDVELVNRMLVRLA